MAAALCPHPGATLPARKSAQEQRLAAPQTTSRRCSRNRALSRAVSLTRSVREVRRRPMMLRAVAGDAGAVAGEAVEFVLVRECCFGQAFFVVGSSPALGQWDLAKALPMLWSEGHVWTASTSMSPEELQSTEFKFVKMGKRGEVEWQPSANHRLGDGTGPDVVCSDRGGLTLLQRGWAEEEELAPLPEALTAGTPKAEKVAAGVPAEGNGAAKAAAKAKAGRKPASGGGFAQVVEKDAQWGKAVWSQLLGSWGRKTLMEEEDGKHRQEQQ